MPNTTISPNMNLIIPVVGVDPGPDYANNLDASLVLIDQHDHTPGHGVLITPNGLNINLDLPLNDNNITLIRSLRFQSQNAPLSLVTDLSSLYSVTQTGSNGDLWYNDASGNQIQITKTGAVLATISALISGTNEASFVANQLVVNAVQSNGTPANIKAGSILLGNNSPGTNFLTLQPPNAMGSSYNVTLPAPNSIASTAILTYDTSNNILGNTSLASIQAIGNPVGSITMYGGAAAPANWLLCDGTSYLRSAFPGLFAAIGTAYGTADGTHFNVPDFRGMFPRGVTGASANDPDSASRTANNAGGNTANNVGSQQGFATQDHTHFMVASHNNALILNGSGGTNNGYTTGGANVTTTMNTDFIASPIALSNSEVRPINLYVNFIIKT